MNRLLAMVALCACAGVWLVLAGEAAPMPDPAVSSTSTASVKVVTCPCNEHVLAIKGDTVFFCACEKNCKCTLAEDGKHCTCGKSVQTYNCAGKFVCVACKSVSPTEGKCPKCGKPMTKVETPAPPAAK